MPGCRIPVTDSLRGILTKHVKGEGGFQDFLRDLSERSKGDVIEFTEDEIAKVHRYVDEYGEGGFQDRLEAISEAIKAHCE